MSTEQQTPRDNQPPIVARAGTYYRNARYIMFAIIVAMGAWFLYDGFVAYPESNKKYDALVELRAQMDKAPDKRDEAEYLRVTTQIKSLNRHDDFSILLQKLLGFLLPPIGIGLLIYWLRQSRGEIRLENMVLSAPGFPPVHLDRIDELDKQLWEKKGIAFVFYTLEDNVTGKLRLDDFVYQARPIRAIVKRIEDELTAQDALIAEAKAQQEQVPPPAAT